MTVSGMAEKVTWWNGPDFLEKEESDWPVNHEDTEVVLEEAETKKTDQKCSTQSNQQKGNWTLMAVFEQSWHLSPKRFSVRRGWYESTHGFFISSATADAKVKKKKVENFRQKRLRMPPVMS